MLVLSRSVGTSIKIGELLTVTPTRIKDSVTLSISAPTEIPVRKDSGTPPENIESFGSYAKKALGPPVSKSYLLKRDESICIANDITVTVVDVRGDKVRLGIQHPTDIPVHRQEVYEAIQRENERAANAQKPQNPENAKTITSAETVEIWTTENGIEIFIDPGNATKETIQEVLESLSDLHIAAGGLGLEFIADDMHVHSMETVVK